MGVQTYIHEYRNMQDNQINKKTTSRLRVQTEHVKLLTLPHYITRKAFDRKYSRKQEICYCHTKQSLSRSTWLQ